MPEQHTSPAKSPLSSPAAQAPEFETWATGSVYETLTGLPFSFRIGDTTCFDHSKGEVVIGVQQLLSLGIADQRMLDFIVIHELGHFKELHDDPLGYKSILDESSQGGALGKAHFRFYNALMDIYVNTNTRNKAPIYSDGGTDFSPEVKELYQAYLFKERDFSTLPLSTQYSYYLLNMGMGVANDITISPEVKQAIAQPLKLYGASYTTEQVIDTFLRPAIGTRSTKEWRATISQRKQVIDQALRPVFERLIKADQAAGRNPNEGLSGGDLERVEASPEELKKAVQDAIQKKTSDSRSAEQKAQDQRSKDAEELARKQLLPEQAKDLADSLRRVQPSIIELTDLLKQIVKDAIDYKKREQGFFTRGSTLDIQQAIRAWDKIATLPSNARVMTRGIYEEVPISKPREIRVWLSIDLSGSMDGDIQLLRDLTLTFSGAMQTLSIGTQMGQHNLKGSLGIIGFNDDVIEVLPLTTSPTFEHVAKAYKHLQAGGATAEHTALKRILDAVRADPPSIERVDIVIGITDGETSNPVLSHAYVQELEQLGVKLCAFKFGRTYVAPDIKPDPSESRMPDPSAIKQATAPPPNTFAQIWNTPNGGQLGSFVRSAAQVIPALKTRLRDVLNG